MSRCSAGSGSVAPARRLPSASLRDNAPCPCVPAGLSSPLQILAAQASSSPPVLLSRQPSGDSPAQQPGEPQAKRPKMEEEGGTEPGLHPAPPAQQPVIVAMTSQSHEARK